MPFINYNGVVGVGDEIDATLTRVRAWGVPARWTVSSTSASGDFESTLEARGLELYEEAPGMAARIADLPEPQLGSSTLEIVRDRAGSDQWADVLRDAFALPPESARQSVQEAHAWPHMHNAGMMYLIVRVEGEAVATGLVRFASGVAGVYGITVRRAFQRRGLGSLATLLTVREGARRGARVAILQATKEGFPVYEKLGFRTLTSFRSWRIS